MVLLSFSFGPCVYLHIKYFYCFQDQEEPEGEDGASAEEASPDPQRSSPSQDSYDQSPPVSDQIPPLDNSDTIDNESTTLLNEESD